jgi:hypothetical protein
MIRILSVAAALMLSMAANAGEFRVGAGNVSTEDEGNSYITTYPGEFCVTKAIRVSIADYNNGGSVKIGRVYLAFQQPGEKGPYRAYAIVNQTLAEGQSTAWIQIPQNYGCLKRVRVYADAKNRWSNDDREESYRVIVWGAN